MINPNATSSMYAEVLSVSTSRDGSLNLKVLTISGHELSELGFIYHKSIKVGDLVKVEIGFSIMSDRYGVKAVRKMNKNSSAKTRVLNLLARY